MKQSLIILLAIITTLTISCNNSLSGGNESTGENLKEIQTEFDEKFGSDAYYTNLVVTYTKQIGNIMNVTTTKKPESLKMEEWTKANGGWEQVADVTLEIPEGTKAKEYMFQLNKDINLIQLGDLIKKSIEHLKAEKQIENPILNLASINFPDDGNIEDARYYVTLIPENGGTSFSYFYDLSGNLIDFNY